MQVHRNSASHLLPSPFHRHPPNPDHHSLPLPAASARTAFASCTSSLRHRAIARKETSSLHGTRKSRIDCAMTVCGQPCDTTRALISSEGKNKRQGEVKRPINSIARPRSRKVSGSFWTITSGTCNEALIMALTCEEIDLTRSTCIRGKHWICSNCLPLLIPMSAPPISAKEPIT